jgi:hypothetical protein
VKYTRCVLPSLVFVISCSNDPTDHGEDAANAGSESGADTMAVDLPGCDPEECMQACQHDEDQCGEPLVGSCSETDDCVCQLNSDCQLCDSENCSAWSTCYDPYTLGGLCHTSCYHAFQFVWDPLLGCDRTLPADLPVSGWVASTWFVVIGPDVDAVDPLQRAQFSSCADPEAWTLNERARMITLCPNACMAFEAAGVLWTGWGLDGVCE